MMTARGYSRLAAMMTALALWGTGVAYGDQAEANGAVVAEAKALLDNDDAQGCVGRLVPLLKEHPGFEEAYVVLGRAYEALGEKDKAIEIWDHLRVITRDRDRRQEARLGLLRMRGPEKPVLDDEDVWKNDPYKVDIGEVDWGVLENEVKGLQVQYNGKMPPVPNESTSFTVYSCTRHSAEFINDLCQKYLEFLLKTYFHAGQEWVLRTPIIVYKDHQDYVQKGGYPASSAGVTQSDTRTGTPVLIAMYMLDQEGQLDRDAIDSTLPHELTHLVINEWFGSVDVPRWINEGLARRMEQGRNHYVEAAKLGRDAVAGEYFRFRELFAQKEYPHRGDRTFRFYEQSATILLFLLEQYGPESAVAFFEELRRGKNHDEATAGALGIPVDGAVDEFEKRWFEWIRNIYAQHRDRLEEGEIAQATALDAYATSFDEVKTAESISEWSAVSTDSMDRFRDLGGSHRHWSAEGGKLKCDISHSRIGSLVGIRTDEEPIMMLRCKVRAPQASYAQPTVFGIGMLDHRADDTGIQVRVVLQDRNPHDLLCVVGDEIALYVDGACAGRDRALLAAQIDEDIDWPLAFVGYAPVEVWDVETTMAKKLAPATAEEETEQN